MQTEFILSFDRGVMEKLEAVVKKLEAVVKLVREDGAIGRGTCSTVDECLSDDDLIEGYICWLVDESPKSVADKYLLELRRQERIQQERAEEIRQA